MSIFAMTVLLCTCTTTVIVATVLLRASTYAALFSNSSAAGQPLLLTPLIDAGKLEQARNLSRVEPLLGDIRSYAGYFTVNRTTKSHLYFWLILKTTNNVDGDGASAPLVLWLQGGPGQSSLYGLFNENGPFQVVDESLRMREHAWTNAYHMLYIDQPIDAGFSFTEKIPAGYISTQEEVGQHLHEALVQFYKLFPEFRTRDLYIAGESYAGKYVPAIGYKVHTANLAGQPGGVKIPLKGMMIGNGYWDPENMLEYADYLHALGLIDRNTRVRMEKKQEKIRYLIRSKLWSKATAEYEKLIIEISGATQFLYLYDFTRENLHYNESYVRFLMKDQIRKSIHAGLVEYRMMSWVVYELSKEDHLKTVRPLIEELLEHYPMLFYSGQLDIIVAHPLNEMSLSNLHWSGASEYDRARRVAWQENDTVIGYWKSAGNLVNVLVRNAGHMVPCDQPKNTLNMIKKFVGKHFNDSMPTIDEKEANSLITELQNILNTDALERNSTNPE